MPKREISNDNQYKPSEVAQRLRAVLEAAFKRPPTPLKDIPKKTRESRRLKRGKTTPGTSKPG